MSLGPGKKSLERGSTFKTPRSELKRSTQVSDGNIVAVTRKPSSLGRRRSKPKRTEVEKQAMLEFKLAHCYLPCVVCGYESPKWTDGNDVHHVLSQDWLERHGFAHLAWDPRDGVSVCPIRWPRGNNCHGRHELSVERIPVAALTGQNHEFGIEVMGEVMGEAWDGYVARYYGRETT